jgi:hypothetical protein
MSTLRITGVLKVIGETKEYGQNGFLKREFVIETEGEYPQTIGMEMTQLHCEKLDHFVEGQIVEVEFGIRGKEFVNKELEKKYFNSLNAYKISPIN